MNSICSIIWDVSPVIFSVGDFQLRYYSLLFAAGFIIGYFIVKHMFNRENIPLKELDSLLIYVLVGGLLGARLGHCIFYDWAYFSDHLLEIILPVRFEPEFHFTGYRGLASHGGALGILVALIFFTRKSTRKNYLWTLDRVAVPTALAGALIRLGNLMNSEIYGHQTDLPWGFVFMKNGENFASHPTQIYEAVAYIIVFIVLMLIYRRSLQRLANGVLLGWFLVLIFIARFFIEYVKEVQVPWEEAMRLNMGQILSIPFILAGLGILIFAAKDKTGKAIPSQSDQD